MAELSRAFLEDLPAIASELDSAIAAMVAGDASAGELALRVTHRLSGSAGSHGQVLLGDLASVLHGSINSFLRGSASAEDLELTHAALRSAAQDAVASEPPSETPEPRRFRALIVDDDPHVRKMVQVSLERVGKLDVVVAASGAEALAIVGATELDGIVLDVMMPDLDGPATLAAIRAALENPPPTVFLTAKIQPAEADRLMELGAVGVIFKPFDPMLLPSQVQALFQGSDVIDRTERRKTEFISTVSHELRTPLTSIRGALGLLEGGVLGPMSEEALELVGIARRETERLVRLINDLLDVDRVAQGGVRLELKPVRVDDVVSAVAAALGPVAQQASVTLRVTGNNVHAFADADRLTQICVNLIDNAIKFSSAGGVVRVRVIRTHQGRARVEVEDAGPGIPEDAREQLFKKFVQLEAGDARKRPGAGLGLAISKALVEQMHGSIGIYSTEQVGSVFWFELPLSGPITSADSFVAVRKRILVVGADDASERAAALLRFNDYRCTVEPSSALAEARLREESFGAIVVHADSEQGRALLSRPLSVPTLTVGVRDFAPDVPRSSEEERRLYVVDVRDPVRIASAMAWLVAPKTTRRVLVIDDDPSFVAVTSLQLRRIGAVVLTASDLDDAVQIALTGHPSAIVLDAEIGGASRAAFTFVERLRARGYAPPLVVYTAIDLSDPEQAALSVGPTRFLTKGRVTEHDFVEAVRATCRD